MEVTYRSDEEGQCDFCGQELPSGPRTPRWVSNSVGVFCSTECAIAGRKEWSRWPGNETITNQMKGSEDHHA